VVEALTLTFSEVGRLRSAWRARGLPSRWGRAYSDRHGRSAEHAASTPDLRQGPPKLHCAIRRRTKRWDLYDFPAKLVRFHGSSRTFEDLKSTLWLPYSSSLVFEHHERSYHKIIRVY
jgi:hypothetical protein